MTKRTFLVEVGTEELPPTQLKQISEDFTEGFKKSLEKNNLDFDSITPFATPRRFALIVNGLEEKSKSQKVEKRGPAKQACFTEDGSLSKAALGWLKSNGISFDQSTFLETDKGEWLYYSFVQEGVLAKDLLFKCVKEAISNIQISKGMRWANNDFMFIRPIKTFTMLLDEELIPGEVFGVKSSKVIYGHRFLGTQKLQINKASDYEELLKTEGKVIPSFSERLEIIKEEVIKYASKYNGYANIEESLLEEITSLVEYPNVLVANFEKEFLKVPKEALIHTMEGDQRYFPIFTDEKFTTLLPHFIFVSNITPSDPSKVILGNEKVIRPRLTDAKFFYEQDLKKPLESLRSKLKMVVFQKQLGTVYDKTLRLEQISEVLTGLIGANPEYTQRAAVLSKCDLMTNMVFEFTDTQGTMGMYYALAGGENAEVASALNEQYLPRFSGDDLPITKTGTVLSLADKLDTLVGIFGINQPPKGAKDPFALRRASISIIRILTEGKYDIDLSYILDKVIEIYGNKLTVEPTKLKQSILDFINARAKSLYEDMGFSSDEITAVSALNISNPYDFLLRLHAIKQFKLDPAYNDLTSANKRVKNFLQKAELSQLNNVDVNLFSQQEEINLFTQIEELKSSVNNAYHSKKYVEVLTLLSYTRENINSFFDNVIVNAEDEKVKNNRISLLANFNNLCQLVADLSALNA